MSLNANRVRLEVLTRDLLVRWDETKTCWRDARSQEFDRRYMQELRARVDKTSAMIDKLGELLTKVRNDCE